MYYSLYQLNESRNKEIVDTSPFGYTTKYDNIEKIVLSFITNEFFPWVCLIFVLNHQNLKRPVIILLIAHWFLRSCGYMLRYASELLPLPETDEKSDIHYIWPYTNLRYVVGDSLAHLFWLSGEIIGDWYLYLRTKAVTTKKSKIRVVLGWCLLYNAVKVGGIISFFLNLPLDLKSRDSEGLKQNGLLKNTFIWYIIIALIHVTGFCYDLSVMMALRAELFNKLEIYRIFIKDTFMDKFKQISELRIFLTMGATFFFLPIVIPILGFIYKEYRERKNINIFIDLDPLRQVPLGLFYNLIYIDQILLKCIAEREKQQNISGDSSSYVDKQKYHRNLNSTQAFLNNPFRVKRLEMAQSSCQHSHDKLYKSDDSLLFNASFPINPHHLESHSYHNYYNNHSIASINMNPMSNLEHYNDGHIASINMNPISNININYTLDDQQSLNKYSSKSSQSSQYYFNNLERNYGK